LLCLEVLEASFGLLPSVEKGFIWVQVSPFSDSLYVCETRNKSLRFTELRLVINLVHGVVLLKNRL